MHVLPVSVLKTQERYQELICIIETKLRTQHVKLGYCDKMKLEIPESSNIAALVVVQHPRLNHFDSFTGSGICGRRFRKYWISCHNGLTRST